MVELLAAIELFQSAAASWTRRNGETQKVRRQPETFQSAAASWTRRNAIALRQLDRRIGVSIRRRVVDAAECPDTRARAELRRVSIRRRVVDAAEYGQLKKYKIRDVFQSAAASWTRRNGSRSTPA